MKDILIVGANGTIGSELARQLAATGRRFRALVRSETKANGLPALAEPVIGDLLDPSTLSRAFLGAEHVFVLSPPTADLEKMASNAFAAAREAGAKRVVYLSAFGVGILDDFHWRSHTANEKRLAMLGVDWTVLRPTRFMTQTPFAWAPVFEKGLLLEGTHAGTLTTIDPADIAAVALRTLTEDGHRGKIYELTSDDKYTSAHLADTLSKAVGREVNVFQGDNDALSKALIAAGVPVAFAPVMIAYFASAAANKWYVTKTVQEILGRPPRAYAQWLGQNLPRLRP